MLHLSVAPRGTSGLENHNSIDDMWQFIASESKYAHTSPDTCYHLCSQCIPLSDKRTQDLGDNGL